MYGSRKKAVSVLVGEISPFLLQLHGHVRVCLRLKKRRKSACWRMAAAAHTAARGGGKLGEMHSFPVCRYVLRHRRRGAGRRYCRRRSCAPTRRQIKRGKTR